MSFKHLILAVLLTAPLFATPSWFHNIDAKGYELIGYGEGASYDEAVAQAKAEIAGTIRSRVSSEFSSQTIDSGKSYSHQVQSSVKSRSDMVLAGAEVIKREQVKKRFFVAVKYDTRPFGVKFVEKIGNNKKCTDKLGFLNKSPFGRELKQDAGCDLELRLYRNNKTFFLENNAISMAWSDELIDSLFVEQQNIDLEFKASKESLKDGEAFYLSLKSNKMGGYISFFNLYDNGEVALMVGNIENSFGKTIKIPQFLGDDLELIASTNGKKSTKDLFIVMWHSDRLQLSIFEETSDKAVSGSDTITKLIELLDKHAWSSTVVRMSR